MKASARGLRVRDDIWGGRRPGTLASSRSKRREKSQREGKWAPFLGILGRKKGNRGDRAREFRLLRVSFAKRAFRGTLAGKAMSFRARRISRIRPSPQNSSKVLRPVWESTAPC
jgi:hypothetical protein